MFFVNAGGQLSAVSVRASNGGLVIGAPEKLKLPLFSIRHWGTNYDVSPDGKQFVFEYPPSSRPPDEIRVVMGWQRLLE